MSPVDRWGQRIHIRPEITLCDLRAVPSPALMASILLVGAFITFEAGAPSELTELVGAGSLLAHVQKYAHFCGEPWACNYPAHPRPPDENAGTVLITTANHVSMRITMILVARGAIYIGTKLPLLNRN